MAHPWAIERKTATAIWMLWAWSGPETAYGRPVPRPVPEPKGGPPGSLPRQRARFTRIRSRAEALFTPLCGYHPPPFWRRCGDGVPVTQRPTLGVPLMQSRCHNGDVTVFAI